MWWMDQTFQATYDTAKLKHTWTCMQVNLGVWNVLFLRISRGQYAYVYTTGSPELLGGSTSEGEEYSRFLGWSGTHCVPTMRVSFQSTYV